MDEEGPELLEERAERSAEAGDYAAALALRERAFAAWRALGDRRRAAHLAAYFISFDHLALLGNAAVAQGWLERATRLAAEDGESAEAGWVALSRALHTADAHARAGLVAEATRLARRFADADLEFDALAFSGLALVEAGRVGEGMRRIDEAAAAAAGGEVRRPVVAGEIYCKLLVACESTLDVRRAEEWHPVFAALGERPAVAWASAICRTHYGGILTAAGRWEEAGSELEESVRLYDGTYRALRSAATVRLADLRARQGRLNDARALLAGEGRDGDALRPWARVDWALAADDAGRAVVATRLAHALGRRPTGLLDVPTLDLLTEMQVACGDLDAAARTSRRMVDLVAREPVDALAACARKSRARVAAAGDTVDAAAVAAELEAAVTGFTAARLPLEAAVARLDLAELVRAADPALATAEARAAADALARLGAASELDRADALLRSLGVTGSGPRRGAALSDREQDVLALLAQGLSNPQIAERLWISRKTAAHHVSHVLTKLGLRNRAEAAAWATAHGVTGRR